MSILIIKKLLWCRYCWLWTFSPKAYWGPYRSSDRRCSIKKAVLKNFTTFAGKHLCWSFSFINLLKRDSKSVLFLWILRNFQENLFWRKSADGCFWPYQKFMMKVFAKTPIGFSQKYLSQILDRALNKLYLLSRC